MHGENSNIWGKCRSLRTYAVWAGERAFAFAKSINHCLVLAQNRGFCAKEETQCPKRARWAAHGLRKRGIYADELRSTAAATRRCH